MALDCYIVDEHPAAGCIIAEAFLCSDSPAPFVAIPGIASARLLPKPPEKYEASPASASAAQARPRGREVPKARAA